MATRVFNIHIGQTSDREHVRRRVYTIASAARPFTFLCPARVLCPSAWRRALPSASARSLQGVGHERRAAHSWLTLASFARWFVQT